MPEQNQKNFPSFREFIDSVASSKHADYLGRPTVKVADGQSFEEMKNHILKMAEGVDVTHSFADENGQIFDCVPVEQQASLSQTGKKAVLPSDLPTTKTSAATKGQTISSSRLRSCKSDKFGNLMQCPDGTIPVRRVTMEELSRFGSLHDFFRKPPVGKGRHPRLSPPELASGVHKYAHAFQAVNNQGGHSFVNIWDPAVGSQVFSLAQHWYAGGSPVQTVECGWQVFPQKYQTIKPVLFVYWTADNYGQTGCYNLECSAFVQTSSSWALGSELDTLSTTGGQQFELEIAWHLVDGNWWLYLNGTSSSNAVGYYPTSLFGAGQMSQCATDVDYGGEAVNQTVWPPMGSGAFANLGYQNAAYQRNIFFFDTGGNAQQATLTPSQPSPNCYTIDVESGPDPWDAYFFFGGPGGNSCS